MGFHFRASIKPNLIFSIVLEPFHPQYRAKNENGWHHTWHLRESEGRLTCSCAPLAAVQQTRMIRWCWIADADDNIYTYVVNDADAELCTDADAELLMLVSYSFIVNIFLYTDQKCVIFWRTQCMMSPARWHIPPKNIPTIVSFKLCKEAWNGNISSTTIIIFFLVLLIIVVVPIFRLICMQLM